MIEVTFKLHSAIDGHEEELGSMRIWNDATGTKTTGNYGYELLSKNSCRVRKGRITGYPRRLTVPNLVYRALRDAVGPHND